MIKLDGKECKRIKGVYMGEFGIFKWEKNLLKYIEKNLFWIVSTLVLVLGVLIRIPPMEYVSGDFYHYLSPWFDEIKESGLSHQVGNYNLVYQFLIYIMTKLPLKAIYSYKILSCVFDYLLAIVAGYCVYNLLEKDRRRWGTLAVMGVVILSPVVVLNSSVWAQCDSIFTFFGFLAIAALLKEKYTLSMIMLGVSFAFKLQAVFLLPIFLFVYFVRKRFTIFNFAFVPLAMIACGIPTAFYGRNPLETITIYTEQTEVYPYMSLNYPSIWQLVLKPMDVYQYTYLKTTSICLTVAILLVVMVYWIKKRLSTDGENLLIMAFLLTYLCVLFLPAMHERYSYIYEILAICLAVLRPKTIPICCALHVVTLLSYASFLFGIVPIALPVLSIFNLLIFGLYFFVLNAYMIKGKDLKVSAI
ncbi:MAG: DUF2029 domain-containing protein [Ruminococcaceae bacterium]|nr:DUF2029 domain-containing protein [Oscillospiraceae bacterium]